MILGADPNSSRDVLDFGMGFRNSVAQGQETGLDTENLLTETGNLPLLNRNNSGVKIELQQSELSPVGGKQKTTPTDHSQPKE